jgi:hypothetical protein
MTSHDFTCEDRGCVFIELMPDIQDAPLACPECGGLDIQLVGERQTNAA